MRLHRADPAAAGTAPDSIDDLLDGFEWPTWYGDALCLEPSYDALDFFDGPAAPAKAVCARCLVRGECLDYALEHGIGEGVWGNTSPGERKAMLRNRRAAA